MLSDRRQRDRRRRPPGWPIWLSVALHLTVLLYFLIVPLTQPPTSGSEPAMVEVIMGQGPPTPEPPAPDVPAPPPVRQAETPPLTPVPTPDVPPPPAVRQVDIPRPTPAPVPNVPPPPPVQQAAIPQPTPPPPPEVPPPPTVQQAVAPQPTPPPAPQVTPRSPPVAQVHSPRAPPQRTAAHAAASPAGTRAPAGQTAASHASDADNGAAWMGRLKQWWDQHSFYPKEASQTNEGGAVRVRIVIASDGQITSIQVVQGSGLSVLDAAAVAVFRDAHLPPFPPGTQPQPADVVVTLHYRPADNGG